MCLRSLPFVALFAGTVLLSGGASCGAASTAQPAADGSSVPGAPRLDTARVDSVGVPARIATTDTLRIHLTGTVGPNGCYSLARIDEARTPDQLTVTPLVQPPTDADQACTMAMVPLDTTYAVAPPFEPGALLLTVPQSSRPAVTTSVEVVRDP